MTTHPFRFGIQHSGPADRRDWRAFARRLEDLGYSTLTCADHLDDQFAPIPALTAAAAATSELRLGTMVLANDYRHPVVAAKDAASLDLISDGRLELGIGAGWMTADYESAGLSLDPAGTRVERLAEAVTVIKGLLGPEPLDHAGTHYRITGLDGRPKPVQTPHPPIVIGGGGPRVLALAGREADIVGINVDLRAGVIDERAGPNGTAEETDRKVAVVRGAAGDRADDIELQVRVHIGAVADDRAAMADLLAPALGIDPAAALESPHAVVGRVEEICDQLVERRERWGISYLGLSADAVDDFAPVVARLAGT
jgi:probable F420-dependent oxidoreductase